MHDDGSICAGRAACTPHPTPFTAHCIPPALECEGPMAENKGMSTSTSAGVSRLDKNQSPSFDHAERRPPRVQTPVDCSARCVTAAAPFESVDETPSEITSSPMQPEPASERVEPITRIRSVEPAAGDGSNVPQRILLITALTTLFWAPVAWILNWIA